MGFILSILYFVTYYLTPPTVFGPVAVYRVELIIAMLATIAAIPSLRGSFVLRTPQSIALIGLAIATALSVAFGANWYGGGARAFLLFVPNAFAYFLVCVHCSTRKRLQILIAMLLFVSMFVIGHGIYELRSAASAITTGHIDRSTPYLYEMGNDSGELFYRIRGLGEIHDPNDFAQVLVCILPLIFIFWRPKSNLRNFLLVVLPVCILGYGIFLTHSRGALLALIAVVLVAFRRRIGTFPAIVVAGLLFVGASALHFTGGREISADAGQDRLALWGVGLRLFRAHPLFGVGLGSMPDYSGLTAHNSVVVCAAELGFIGLYFWSMFVCTTIRDAIEVGSPKRFADQKVIIDADPMYAPETVQLEALSENDISRMGRLVLLSLTGFFVTSWFLSRAFVVTLFLLGGMAEVVYQLALARGMIGPRWRVRKTLPYAGGLAVSLIVLMYIVLRTGNIMR